jgi:uncharacterized membrane protein YphA (DoxX/SURF4 family)
LLGDGPPVVFAEQRKPIWLYPNLLSLDAPLVAVAWLYVFAETWRVVYLPSTTYVSLALVVWVLYVADRLLDASAGTSGSARLEARHIFHREHRRIFRVLAVGAAVVALLLVVTGLATKIYGYAIFGTLMVAGFFTLSVFSSHGPDDIPHAKNMIAGFAFAYGTSMLAFAYTGFEGVRLLQSPELICFAVLCILNISAIDLWEHASRTVDLEIKATDELALTLPLVLLGAAALFYALKDPDLTTRPFFYAILTGAALLYILNRSRSKFSPEALRVLADVALLAPVLVFLAASR